VKWVGKLECGHIVSGDGIPPETETEFMLCQECTVMGSANERWYRVAQVVSSAPERGPDGKAW